MIELTIKDLENGNIITATTEFLTAQWNAVKTDENGESREGAQSIILGKISSTDLINRCVALDEVKNVLLSDDPIGKVLYNMARIAQECGIDIDDIDDTAANLNEA